MAVAGQGFGASQDPAHVKSNDSTVHHPTCRLSIITVETSKTQGQGRHEHVQDKHSYVRNIKKGQQYRTLASEGRSMAWRVGYIDNRCSFP